MALEMFAWNGYRTKNSCKYFIWCVRIRSDLNKCALYGISFANTDKLLSLLFAHLIFYSQSLREQTDEKKKFEMEIPCTMPRYRPRAWRCARVIYDVCNAFASFYFPKRFKHFILLFYSFLFFIFAQRKTITRNVRWQNQMEQSLENENADIETQSCRRWRKVHTQPSSKQKQQQKNSIKQSRQFAVCKTSFQFISFSRCEQHLLPSFTFAVCTAARRGYLQFPLPEFSFFYDVF